jgi:HK97 family phage major capsid protein
MSKIADLYDKRNQLVNSTRAFLDERHDKNGVLSAEDETAYNKMEADISALTKEIERESRFTEMENSLKLPVGSPILDKPQKYTDTKTGSASDEYKSSFWNALRGKHYAADTLSVGVDSDGGYLVPDSYEKQLIEALNDENIFRRLAKVITTSGDHKVSVANSKGSADWIEENGAIPESDDSFGQVVLGAYKLGTTIKVSKELLSDAAFNIESYISKEFARRIGTKEEESFFIGDGVGKPTGVLAATGGAQIGTTTATSTTITFDDVFDLFHSLRAPYRNKAVFIVNDATVKGLRKLKDSSGQYLWTPSVVVGTPDTLCNRPVYTSTYMPTVAAGAKPMLFGDLSYYWIADRQGRIFQRLNELYANYGQVGFLATQRVDGKLTLAEAVQVLKMKE